MASINNHHGEFGYNAIGKDKFRNIKDPKKFLSPVDLADFQFAPNKVGITDIDAAFNVGWGGNQITVLIEFKNNKHTAKYSPDHKYEAIPIGQRIALENMAKNAHCRSMVENETYDDPAYRVPGTASLILLVTHPEEEEYANAAAGIVEAVYWANDAYDKTLNPWGPAMPNRQEVTMSQYLDLISIMLDTEDSNRVTEKMRIFAQAALKESGQQSIVKTQK